MSDGGQTAAGGIERACKLLVAIGAAASGEIFKHLSPSEVERLSAEIVRLKRLNFEDKRSVLEEFRRASEMGATAVLGGPDYAAELLKQALGEQKGAELASRLLDFSKPRPFDWLAAREPSDIAKVLSGEMPQTIALVISHLPSEKAAVVLSGLSPSVQGEVALRIAGMGLWNGDVVAQIEQVLREKLSSEESATYTTAVGARALVDLLRYAPRSTERAILDSLTEGDPAVAEEVKSLMFVFEDIITLDDKVIQLLLREVEQEDLRLALKGAPDNIKDLIFRNLSERAAEALKEDMELSGAVRRRDVEAAQQRIVTVLRKMEERGDVVLRVSGSEEDSLVE